MRQMLACVEQAVDDANDALLTAEKKHTAAQTAAREAEAELIEAREVLARLERLRGRMAGHVYA